MIHSKISGDCYSVFYLYSCSIFMYTIYMYRGRKRATCVSYIMFHNSLVGCALFLIIDDSFLTINIFSTRI